MEVLIKLMVCLPLVLSFHPLPFALLLLCLSWRALPRAPEATYGWEDPWRFGLRKAGLWHSLKSVTVDATVQTCGCRRQIPAQGLCPVGSPGISQWQKPMTLGLLSD